jgi:methanogenic corrinoid protein MtbC1
MAVLENTGQHGDRGRMTGTGPSVEGRDADGGVTSSVGVLLDRYQLPEGPAASTSARQRRIHLLTQTIERQILPRLGLTHRDAPAGAGTNAIAMIDDAGLAAFTAAVLAHDLDSSTARIQELVERGAGVADICLSVLTPTARRLGEMWDEDLCSFVDVTAGLGMLHTIMYRLREICAPAEPMRDASRRILFASLAGNQHTFGLQMVTEVFRQAGWDVAVETAKNESGLAEIVRGDWFAIAGISVARMEQTRNLGQTIRAIRKASSNRTIGILVGGPVFDAQPDLARRVGADVDACDAKQAVLRAEGLRLLIASMEHDSYTHQP